MPSSDPLAGSLTYKGHSRIPEALPTSLIFDQAEVSAVGKWIGAVTVEIAGLKRLAAVAGFNEVVVAVAIEKGSTVITVTEEKEVEEL